MELYPDRDGTSNANSRLIELNGDYSTMSPAGRLATVPVSQECHGMRKAID